MPRASRRNYLSPSLSQAPEPLKALFRGVEIYDGLSAIDLREMAKFTETTNIEGLPIHPISRPYAGGVVREFEGALADLPAALLREVHAALAAEPTLLVRGSLAGACSHPFPLAAITPQRHAHLAHGLHTAFWPLTAQPAETWHEELLLIFLPDFEESFILGVPAARVVLVLGTDDLRGGMLVALESAHRYWSVQAEGPQGKETKQTILPGGSFVYEQAGTAGADPCITLVFSGESVPDEWEQALAEKLPEFEGRHGVELLIAGAEPWVAQAGGWVCPLWYAPPLPGELLARSEAWRLAALHPKALPFGVQVDAAGVVHLATSQEKTSTEPYVIVPRQAIPAPFPRSAAPVKVSRVLTHKHSKVEAKEIWALGFPDAEIV